MRTIQTNLVTPTTYYDLLQVPPSIDEAGLKSAWRSMSRKYHPDKLGAGGAQGELWVRMREGYEVLMEPNARMAYDRYESLRVPLSLSPIRSGPELWSSGWLTCMHANLDSVPSQPAGLKPQQSGIMQFEDCRIWPYGTASLLQSRLCLLVSLRGCVREEMPCIAHLSRVCRLPPRDDTGKLGKFYGFLKHRKLLTTWTAFIPTTGSILPPCAPCDSRAVAAAVARIVVNVPGRFSRRAESAALSVDRVPKGTMDCRLARRHSTVSSALWIARSGGFRCG